MLDPKTIDPQKFIAKLGTDRQRARVDTLWLAREVLGYKDIEDDVHGPIISKMQKFVGGRDEINFEAQDLQKAFRYTPHRKIWELDGYRDYLFLDPRGGFKTTLITITGAIQFILNYPEIRILFVTATGDQHGKLITEIKAHFQFNEKLRFLFPEFCPLAAKSADFGNQDGFTVPARRRRNTKEPTLSVASVGKVVAGGHYEAIFISDIVDKENVKTPGQIKEVINFIKYLDPLVERSPIPPHHGWKIVDGTRYDFSDFYGTVIDEETPKGDKSQWMIHKRGCYDDKEQKSWFPSRFPIVELKRMEQNLGPWIFSAQMKNHPIPTSGGLAEEGEILFMKRQIIKDLLPELRLHVTIDLAGMDTNSEGDSEALTLGGFDRQGRLYAIEMICSHLTPLEVIENIFDWQQRYPRIIDFKIEAEAHSRVLLPFLKRAMTQRNIYPIIVPIKRDNRTSKKHRIRGLQPWFKAGIIRFADDLACKAEIIQQIRRFSGTSNYHDDILDTLADQMQNRDDSMDVNLDVIPQGPRPTIPMQRPNDRFMGFDPITKEEMWFLDEMKQNSYYDPHTGL